LKASRLPQGRLLVVREFFVEDCLALNEKPPAATLALDMGPANKHKIKTGT